MTNEFVESLVRNPIREDLLEYKLLLPGNSDGDKKEFAADVCSFANAIGGEILYGVEADKGVPVNCLGLPVVNPDGEILRLQQFRDPTSSRGFPVCTCTLLMGLRRGPLW